MSRQRILAGTVLAALLASAGLTVADPIWNNAQVRGGNDMLNTANLADGAEPTSMPDRLIKRPVPCTAPDPGNVEISSAKAPLCGDLRKPGPVRADKADNAGGEYTLSPDAMTDSTIGPSSDFHPAGGGGGGGSPIPAYPDEPGALPLGPGPIHWPAGLGPAHMGPDGSGGPTPPETPIAPDTPPGYPITPTGPTDPGTVVVPEPTSGVLLVIGGAALLARRRRRGR